MRQVLEITLSKNTTILQWYRTVSARQAGVLSRICSFLQHFIVSFWILEYTSDFVKRVMQFEIFMQIFSSLWNVK